MCFPNTVWQTQNYRVIGSLETVIPKDQTNTINYSCSLFNVKPYPNCFSSVRSNYPFFGLPTFTKKTKHIGGKSDHASYLEERTAVSFATAEFSFKSTSCYRVKQDCRFRTRSLHWLSWSTLTASAQISKFRFWGISHDPIFARLKERKL